MTSRGQCSRGGGACECLHPPPPFRKSCIRACVPPIQVETPTPPHPHLAGWLYGPAPYTCLHAPTTRIKDKEHIDSLHFTFWLLIPLSPSPGVCQARTLGALRRLSGNPHPKKVSNGWNCLIQRRISCSTDQTVSQTVVLFEFQSNKTLYCLQFLGKPIP